MYKLSRLVSASMSIRRADLGTHPTVGAALDAIGHPIVFCEEDADHPDHFDAFAADGMTYAVAPVGSKFA